MKMFNIRSTYFKALTTSMIAVTLLILGKASAGVVLNGYSQEDEISNAKLIVKGKLIETYSHSENIPESLDLSGNTTRSQKLPDIQTIYIFNIEEVMKGDIHMVGKDIEVVMPGGCNSELGLCIDYSFSYYYSVGEQGILLLIEGTKNNYRADQGSYSAYSIVDDNILIRKSSGEEEKSKSFSYKEDKTLQTNDIETLQSFKSKINKWKQSNEK